MTGNSQPDKPQSNSEIVLSNSEESTDLIIIKDALSERIKLAETPEEIEKYLKLRNDLQAQIKNQEYNQFEI